MRHRGWLSVADICTTTGVGGFWTPVAIIPYPPPYGPLQCHPPSFLSWSMTSCGPLWRSFKEIVSFINKSHLILTIKTINANFSGYGICEAMASSSRHKRWASKQRRTDGAWKMCFQTSMYTLGIGWDNLILLKHQGSAGISLKTLPQAGKWERCPCLSIPRLPTGAAVSWATYEDISIHFLAFCLSEFSLSGRFCELLSVWAWATFQSCQVHKVFFICSMFCDNPIDL